MYKCPSSPCILKQEAKNKQHQLVVVVGGGGEAHEDIKPDITFYFVTFFIPLSEFLLCIWKEFVLHSPVHRRSTHLFDSSSVAMSFSKWPCAQTVQTKEVGCRRSLCPCQPHALRSTMLVRQYQVGEALFDALNRRQRCISGGLQGGLHFKHVADHDLACRRSLQRSTAMISFDAAEKKVTGGAWFGISSNYLLQASAKHRKEVFGSFCHLRVKNGPKVDEYSGDSGT